MSKESLGKLFEQSKPYMAVVCLQFGYAGAAIIAKSALNAGMSHYTFAVYRNLFAAVTFAPFAVVLERKIRPKMTFSVIWKIILLSLLEPVIDQNLFYEAMKYTTATFATAMTNMLPALTFLLAWILRLERVNIKELRSQAKIVGTIVTVGGAMIMTLVTGPSIGLPWTRDNGHVHATISAATQQDPVKGTLMITAGCLSWAGFYILQAITLKSYPAGLSLTSLICMCGALQGTVVTLVAQRGNARIWSIHWDSILLSYVYSGIMSSGVAYYVSGIVMRTKGPVFVTAFSPLSMVIVAILSTFILSEKLNFGRVFGAFVIVVGLYLVIWGKGRDAESSSKSNNDQTLPIDQQLSDTNLARNQQVEATKAISGENAV